MAKRVIHSKWGNGEILLVNESAQTVDVLFEHGIEQNIPIADIVNSDKSVFVVEAKISDDDYSDEDFLSEHYYDSIMTHSGDKQDPDWEMRDMGMFGPKVSIHHEKDGLIGHMHLSVARKIHPEIRYNHALKDLAHTGAHEVPKSPIRLAVSKHNTYDLDSVKKHSKLDEEHNMMEEAPVKRGRGRPRKDENIASDESSAGDRHPMHRVVANKKFTSTKGETFRIPTRLGHAIRHLHDNMPAADRPGFAAHFDRDPPGALAKAMKGESFKAPASGSKHGLSTFPKKDWKAIAARKDVEESVTTAMTQDSRCLTLESAIRDVLKKKNGSN